MKNDTLISEILPGNPKVAGISSSKAQENIKIGFEGLGPTLGFEAAQHGLCCRNMVTTFYSESCPRKSKQTEHIKNPFLYLKANCY